MNSADLNPVEAEDIVIGQILFEPDCISRAMRVLNEDHFFGQGHRLIFQTAHSLWKEGIPVDLITMTQALRKSGKLEFVGGPFQLSLYTNRVAQTLHLEHHAAIVRENYRLRVLRDGGLRLASGANAAGDPEDLMGKLANDVSKASMADIGNDVNAGDRAYEMLNEEKPKPVYLGMPGVDDLVFLLPGNVVTVSAPSGVGKTAFALSAVLNLMRSGGGGKGLKPWFVSLEMPADELISRALCQLAFVNIASKLQDRLEPHERERLAQAANTYADLLKLLDIDDSGHMTIDMLRAKAEHKVRQEGVKLIVIDYAQLMDADRKIYPNEALQNEAISKGIRSMTRELNIITILVVHLNRAGEAHGSTQYEKDAHVRLKLIREEGSPDSMGVDVVKNRNGSTGMVNTPCSMQFGLVGRTANSYPF